MSRVEGRGKIRRGQVERVERGERIELKSAAPRGHEAPAGLPGDVSHSQCRAGQIGNAFALVVLRHAEPLVDLS